MSLFADHPRARWAVPAAVVASIATGGLVANQAASAHPSLPPRTAAQLLVDVQQARLSGISGTVVQTSNLGLPELPGMSGSGLGGGSSSLTSMISGTHTWRLWYAGPQQVRVALVGSLGESDIVRNGRDVWVWSSRDKTAQHSVVSSAKDARKGESKSEPKSESTSGPTVPGGATPLGLPTSPQAAADEALAALDPTTVVTTSGTASVAGRDAYELVLRPRTTKTLVSQVRISVDAVEHVPLRVQVYSTRAANPAIEVSFTHVDFGKPDASRFQFNPPPGTTVTQSSGPSGSQRPKPLAMGTARPGAAAAKAVAHAMRTVGTGWSTVVVGTLPQQLGAGQVPGLGSGTKPGGKPTGSTGSTDRATRQLEAVLAGLPHVSGSWGSGRLLRGTLFSVLLTDDGRVAVGAVPAEQLFAALSTR